MLLETSALTAQEASWSVERVVEAQLLETASTTTEALFANIAKLDSPIFWTTPAEDLALTPTTT
jgi:hypothetical protein